MKGQIRKEAIKAGISTSYSGKSSTMFLTGKVKTARVREFIKEHKESVGFKMAAK